jgi:hypothetical protein
MKNKSTRITLGLLAVIFIIFCISLYNAGERVGKYSCTKPYDELTLLEKIASKVEGYDIKTKDELKKEEQKAIEDARKDKEEKAKEEGTETAQKINDRIKKGDFTMGQYTQFDKTLMEKLKNKKITIEELNEMHEKLADGNIKIEDYLK